MDKFYQFPWAFQIVIFGRASIQAFGAPGDVVDSTERVDVQDVEVGRGVKKEGEGSEDDLKENVAVAEENHVEENGNEIDE